MVEKYSLSLNNSEKSVKLADHLFNVTLPLFKEHRLLLKVITELYSGVINLINSVLQHDYYHKRITLYNDSSSNLSTFRNFSSKRLGISSDDLSSLFEVIRVFKAHKSSQLVFVKDDKVVMMADNLKSEILTHDKVKRLLLSTKKVLLKVKDNVG